MFTVGISCGLNLLAPILLTPDLTSTPHSPCLALTLARSPANTVQPPACFLEPVCNMMSSAGGRKCGGVYFQDVGGFGASLAAKGVPKIVYYCLL